MSDRVLSGSEETLRTSSTIPLVSTNIHCGGHIVTTTTFNVQSSIDEIHGHVRASCGSHVPNDYCLLFYHIQLKQFVALSQKYLFGESNLFRLNSSIVAHNGNQVDLWVHDMASGYNILSGVGCPETNLTGSSDAMAVSVSEEDVPVNTEETNVNDSSGEDPVDALLSKEQDDIDLLMHNVLTSNDQESPPVHPNETQSNSNSIPISPSSDNINHDPGDLNHALLSDRPPIQNLPVTHTSSRSIPAGVTMPLQNASVVQTGVQLSTVETQSVKSTRLYFSLDVKPIQKKIYKSDRYNQKRATKINGYVTRIQGIKTLAEKMSRVWPRIRIPELFRNKPNLRLVVYVVSEKLQNGWRIWSKHRDKGFLPKGFTRESQSINPIKFEVTRTSLTIAGDLILDLQMTTLWDKLTEHPMLYQLDEQSTVYLHPALHDPISPRLLCFLEDDTQCYLNTICLSGFIRSVSPAKRPLPIPDNTAQTHATARKRARAK